MQTRVSILPAIKRVLSSKRGIIKLFALAAALLAMAVALFISLRKESFYFEVEMRSSQPGAAQLYYNLGKGMNERDSAGVPVRAGDSMTTVRFPLPPGDYGAFRFDPIDHGYCNIVIGHARIVDISGNTLWDFSPKDFVATHDISRIRTTRAELNFDLAVSERDPYLTINLPAPLALRPSMMSFWQFTIRIFFVYFLLFSLVGICWVFFAPLHWTANAILLSILVGFIYLFARARFLGPINFDEEIFVWSGWAVKNGSIPYRDLFQPKPPVIFFANTLGIVWFGLKDGLFRIVPTAVALLSVLSFCYAMLRRRVVFWLTLLLTGQLALWLLGGDFHDTSLNDSETYGLAFTVLGLSFGLIAISHRTTAGLIGLSFLSGAFFGLGVLSKEIFVLSVIPAWIVVAVKRGDRSAWTQLFATAGGGAFAALSFVAYLLVNSTLGDYLAVLRFGRTFAADYCIDIGRFPRVSGLSVLVESWRILHHQLYNLDHLAFLLPLWAAALLVIRSQSRRILRTIELSIGAIAILLGMISIAIGHCFWQHYFLMGTAGLLLFSVIGAEVLSDYLGREGRVTKLITCVILLGGFVFVSWNPTRVMLTHSPPLTLYLWEPIVTETVEKHSRPGDYILATEGPLIYAVLNRQNPIPVIAADDTILPYMATDHARLRMDALRDELERHLPKVCYFAGQLRPRQKMWHELLYDPLLAKHHYVQVTDRLWYLPDAR